MSKYSVILGRPVTTDGIPERYTGSPGVKWAAPEPGIDNLGLHSWDTLSIPGVGDFDLEVDGFVRVVRSKPTDTGWHEAEVYTNLIEMKMVAESAELGRVITTLSPDVLSAGQIRTPFDPYAGEGPAAKACRMAVGCQFYVPRLNKTLFNREPVILTIDDVRSIPPAGAPGKGQISRMLPMFDIEDPDGNPVAYLTSLRFNMGGYLEPERVQEIRDL